MPSIKENWRDNCKNCPFFDDCGSTKSEKECVDFLNKKMLENLRKISKK